MDGVTSAPVHAAELEPRSLSVHRVGWGFIALFTAAHMSTCLLFLAPALVTLALKVNSLVGLERAPSSLALVAGIGAVVAMFSYAVLYMIAGACAIIGAGAILPVKCAR